MLKSQSPFLVGLSYFTPREMGAGYFRIRNGDTLGSQGSVGCVHALKKSKGHATKKSLEIYSLWRPQQAI
jgi:hypothetical protein